MSPVIIIDTREQTPWTFGDVPTERRKLDAGDYSIAGLENRVAIERKSIADLVGTLTAGRERFERELARLATYDRAAIFVEGSLEDVAAGRYRSTVSPAAIIASLGSFWARFDVPTVFAGDARHAAALARVFLLKAHKYLAAPIAA